jgi:hypothetical protein
MNKWRRKNMKKEWNLIELMLEDTIDKVFNELYEKYVEQENRFKRIELHIAYYGDTDRYYNEEDGTFITLKPKTYQLSTDNCTYKNLYSLVEELILNTSEKRNPVIYLEGFKVKGSQIDINMCVDQN